LTYLVVGLGNPGKKYENTRHNIGYRVIEKLARKLVVSPDNSNRYFLKAEGEWEDNRMVLLQPLTYMNKSGLAVNYAIKKYNLFSENISQQLIVVYDDMDIEPGRIKIKPKGGSGGHRGIDSIVSHLSSNEFIRIRIGIGRPPPWMEGSHYVLGKPIGEEREDLLKGEDIAVEAVLEIVSRGLNEAMNSFNKVVDN